MYLAKDHRPQYYFEKNKKKEKGLVAFFPNKHKQAVITVSKISNRYKTHLMGDQLIWGHFHLEVGIN